MRSIPAAMTWELLTRGRWNFLLAALGGLAFPTMILFALRMDGRVDAHDPSMILMNVVMMHVSALIFGAALFAAQGPISKLYAYPVRTSEMVAWRLLPAMLIMAIEMVLNIVVLNALFDLNWPIWGPATVASVAFAAVAASVWLTDKSAGWLIIAVTVVAAVLGLWFKSRYGTALGQPTHFWQHVTTAEAFTMLASAIAAYWVAVKAVARNRRGEPPLSLGLIDWLTRIFDPSFSNNALLKTAFQAQCWFEWRRKGWAMPGTVLVLLVIGFVVWFFGNRSVEDLFEGLLGAGGMLPLVAFVGGLLFGNVGRNDADYAMGNFLATRPLSDTDIARAILRTAFKSVLATWASWAVAFGIVCACLAATGWSSVLRFPKDVSWWYFPFTLLAPWAVAATLASLCLFGHSRFLVAFLCSLFAAIVAIGIGSKLLLEPATRALVAQCVTAVLAASLVLAGAWMCVAARKRALIQWPTFWSILTIWLATTVLIGIASPLPAEPQLLGHLLAAAAVALVVVPLAAAPLAISWNRHR